jgi:hypothetical protein
MANPRTAGYASVTSVGPDVVNGLLAAATASVTMPSFSLPNVVTVGSDQIGLSGTLTLSAPQVVFTANPGNLIDVTFGGSGTLTLTDNGLSLVEVAATLETTLDLSFVVDVTPTSLAIAIDTSTATVASISTTVQFGPPLVTEYQQALTSGPVLAAFTAALQAIPAAALTFTVPGASGKFDLNYGGIGISLAASNVVVVPLDGVLNIAADVAGYTMGNASNLVNLITTHSPTSIYSTEGTQKIGGGTFGSHSTAQVGDNYIYGGINLAIAVNTDFLCAVFNGPLSNALANTLLSVDPTTMTSNYTVVSGDTTDSITAALYAGFETQQTNEELFSAGITLALSKSTISLSSPPSVLPPAPSATYTTTKGVTYWATNYVTIGPTAPDNTITVTGVPAVGDSITVTIPAGGIMIKSVSLQCQAITPVLPNCSPGLPTVYSYDCLSVAMNGEMQTFFNPQPGVWAMANAASFTFAISFTPIVQPTLTGLQWAFPCANWSFSSSILSFIDDIFPLGPFLFAGAINAAVSSLISNGLAGGGLFDLAANGLNGSMNFPGSSTWKINYMLLGLVVCPPQSNSTYAGDELNAYATVTVTGPTSQLSAQPQFGLSADDSHSLTNLLPIFVQLTVNNGTPLFNPALGLRIRWTASRNDTGVEVFYQDTPFTTEFTAINVQRADGPTGDLIYNDTWTVTCMVYRPADSLVPQYAYYNQTIQVGLTDVVDRHHPYVQWVHTIGIHDPAGPPELPLKNHKLWFRQRTAKIHRTDLLIRCSMLDRAMLAHPQIAVEYPSSLAPYGTLEDLTHPHLVPKGKRKVLCDYCFFGGPTKNVWLTPTAPTPDWE